MKRELSTEVQAKYLDNNGHHSDNKQRDGIRGDPESELAMRPHTKRRVIIAILIVAGPILGAIVGRDRGLLFGGVVSVLAAGWFLVEERKIL